MTKISRIFFPLQQKMYEIAFDTSHEDFCLDEAVIVRHDDLGENLAYIKGVNAKREGDLCKEVKILRPAEDKDIDTYEQREVEARKEFLLLAEKIKKYSKEMSPISAQISLDGNLFYATFTAPDRVDFRELVKDLSSEIHKRIYFEQIGIRDRARILGDLGKCGQQTCCSRFLAKLPSVSMEAARVQNLSSQQIENITGICCKLKCCLNYEAGHYREKRKTMPKLRKKVIYEGKEAKVIGLDILSEKVKICILSNHEIIMVDNSQLSRPKT